MTISRAEMFVAGALGRRDAGDPRQAADLANLGLAGHPDSGRLWEVRGCALWLAGDPDAALECLEQASLLVPLGAMAQACLADAYAERRLPCRPSRSTNTSPTGRARP